VRVGGLAVLWAVALAAPGCARKPKDDPCGEGHAALVEVRDGQGVLQAALRSGGGPDAAPALCDEAGRSLGVLARPPDGRGLWLRGPASEVLVTPGPGATDDATVELVEGGCAPARDPAGAGPRCRRLRLHRGGALLRVLDEDGVPLGQIEGQAGGAAVRDAGGRTLFTCARVEAQDAGRLAIRATDGATRFLLFGLGDEPAAAALGLPSLSLAQRLVVARFLAAR